MPILGAIQSYRELLTIFPEEAIYYHYLGHCKIGQKFLSVIPQRLAAKGRVESDPSMMLKMYPDKILWFDFGLPDQIGYTVVHLVMYLYNLQYDYHTTLSKIYEDMVNGPMYIPTITFKQGYELSSQIKYRKKLLPAQLEYYKRFHIKASTLDQYNVMQATELKYNGILWHKSTPEDFMNLFMFSEEYHCWHLNRPYAEINKGVVNKNKKHRPNNMFEVIMGCSQLPKNGNLCLITKAYKEVMLLSQEIAPAVCKYAERIIMNDQEITVLKNRFKYLVNWGDNDSTGHEVAKIYKERYNIPSIFTPNEKDPTDFAEKYGLQELHLVKTQFLNQFING